MIVSSFLAIIAIALYIPVASVFAATNEEGSAAAQHQVQVKRTYASPSSSSDGHGGHRPVSGWPESLDIVIDKLELGGLTIPSIQSIFMNTKVGAKNLGNIAESTSSASVGHGHGAGEQVVDYGAEGISSARQ